MSSPAWWEKGYPGGPAVGPPFIRPLYPPDAAARGKIPSSNGADVMAIKRGVSRGGHWPWQKFDGAFSNGFAHGRSGNVSENGLAGAQRQNKLDATGWLGEATYNMLRCARIPAGLPHAGEPLFDATAVQLLEDFADLWYAGHRATVREAALAEATNWLGYTESPAGTNANTFGVWYGMNYEPWCAMFVTYCYELSAAGDSPSFVQGSRYHYCPTIVSDAGARRHGLSLVDDPLPGDLVVYDWDGGDYDHVGLFEDGDASSWTAIEGNTSTGNQSNGGQVMRRDRSRSQAAKVAFVRVAEPG